jgi:hypothetical protein
LETSKSLEYGDTHLLTAALFLELNTLNADVIGFPTTYHRKQPSTHHYEAVYFVGARGCKSSKLDQLVIIINGIASYFTCLVKCENAFYTFGLGENFVIDFDGGLCFTRGALAPTTQFFPWEENSVSVRALKSHFTFEIFIFIGND